MYTPPIVGEDIENTQHDDQEGSRPLGFEADSNHGTRGKTEKRDKNTTYTPFSLKNEPKEQEYEQDASSEEETRDRRSDGAREVKKGTDYFLRSVSLMEGRPAKFFFLEMSVSLNTMTRPPITLRFRRKKFMSKMRP